jgi:hypothetical protein
MKSQKRSGEYFINSSKHIESVSNLQAYLFTKWQKHLYFVNSSGRVLCGRSIALWQPQSNSNVRQRDSEPLMNKFTYKRGGSSIIMRETLLTFLVFGPTPRSTVDAVIASDRDCATHSGAKQCGQFNPSHMMQVQRCVRRVCVIISVSQPVLN